MKYEKIKNCQINYKLIDKRPKDMKMSDRKAAKALGVSHNTVHVWRNGYANSIAKAAELAKFLGVDYHDIVLKKNNLTTVGGRLREAREMKGLSFREAAKLIGRHHSLLFQWENNKFGLSTDKEIKEYAKKIGATV